MNKYMEQNWRVENIFLISSQHFLNVTDWEWEALYKHLLYQEGNTGASAICSYTHGGQIWLPTITECWGGKNSCLTSPMHNAGAKALEPKHCPMWHIRVWQEVKLTLVFISEAFTWYHWLSHSCCLLYGSPQSHSFCVYFVFKWTMAVY